MFATCIWYLVPRASTGLSKHGTRPTAVFLLFSVLVQGGGGLHAYFRKQHCMGFHRHDCLDVNPSQHLVMTTGPDPVCISQDCKLPPPPPCASTGLSKHMSLCYCRFDGIF